MVRKSAASLDALILLGAEKLAQVILVEAEINPSFRKRVTAALASTKGPEAVAKLIDRRLAALFAFTEGERAFLQSVLDDGHVDAKSLDVPESVRIAIETCPALRWKAQNVKAWKTGDKSLAPRTRRRALSKGAKDSDGP